MTRQTIMIAAFLVVAPACSQPKAKPSPPEVEVGETTAGDDSSTATGPTMPKASWIQLTTASYPGVFCGTEDRSTRQCYEVTQNDCVEQIRDATQKCMEEIDSLIPAKVHTTAPEPKPALDACVCEEYHKALTDKAVTDGDCSAEAVDARGDLCAPIQQMRDNAAGR